MPRLFAILVLLFSLLALPLSGSSFPLAEPDIDGRQQHDGNCEKEIEDYLEGLRPMLINCLDDATIIDEAREDADLLN